MPTNLVFLFISNDTSGWGTLSAHAISAGGPVATPVGRGPPKLFPLIHPVSITVGGDPLPPLILPFRCQQTGMPLFTSIVTSALRSSLVQSLAYFWRDQDRDRSINILQSQKTRLDRFRRVLVLTSLIWFKTGHLGNFSLVKGFEFI